MLTIGFWFWLVIWKLTETNCKTVYKAIGEIWILDNLMILKHCVFTYYWYVMIVL